MKHNTKTTLCWSCQNAVPDDEGHGCNWSNRLQPVKGWEAKKTYNKEYHYSYQVISCPEYIPDPKDEPDPVQVEELPYPQPEWNGKVSFEDEADMMTLEWGRWFS